MSKSSKYKAILFDMDGTLVPMDMNTFTSGYFKGLCRKVCHLGVAPDKMVDSVWKGTHAMVKNDGSRSNREAFWETFEALTGVSADIMDPECLEFYGNEFKEAKVFTKDNPLARMAVDIAHQKADTVILATNPLFPMVGQYTRMEWVGLTSKDFDLITAYETDNYCKPNPNYYLSICERMKLEPKDCLMIGNDEREDMYAASSIGMAGYLVTDTMIECPEHPWNGPRGTFAELIEFLKNC